MVRLEYPDWVDPANPVAQRLAATLGRIADRVDASVAEDKGKDRRVGMVSRKRQPA